MLGLRSALRSTARGAALASPPRCLSTLPSSFEEMERLDPGGAAYARSVKKLGKLVLKRIVKKSQAKKISSAQKKLIESKWLKKLAKSSHFVIEGDEVVLKKIF